MTHFRDFSSSDEIQPPLRNIDSDAPLGMRQELTDLIFHIVEHNLPNGVGPRELIDLAGNTSIVAP